MALSQALEDALLAWVLGSAFPAPPTALWLSLHNGPVPTLANQIGGWAGGDRLQLTAADFAAASTAPEGGRQRLNARALMLGSQNAPQTVASFAIWDAATGGNLLLSGDVVPDATVNAGDPPVFLSGDLALTCQ